MIFALPARFPAARGTAIRNSAARPGVRRGTKRADEGDSGMGEIVLIRHGQTEWSASGRHTSYTDLELTADGEQQAREAGKRLAGRQFAAVISSPRKRAQHTAKLAGLTVTETTEDLVEWNYGEYEGITTATI